MKSLLVLFVMASFFATGEASIRCYECFGSLACNDPFDPLSIGVHEVLYPPGCFCSKQVVEFASGYKQTSRTCVAISENGPRLADVRDGASFKSYSLHLCDTDICNGASSIIATQITLFTIAGLLILTYC